MSAGLSIAATSSLHGGKHRSSSAAGDALDDTSGCIPSAGIGAAAPDGEALF
jgi:hypothetical protein